MANTMNTQQSQTWPEFLTISVTDCDDPTSPCCIHWNSSDSYKNTSPAAALRRHKERYPYAPIKVKPY